MANDTTVLMYIPDVIGSSSLQGYDPEVGEDKDHTAWVPIDSCSFTLSKDLSAADPSASEEAETVGTMTQVQPITVKRSADYSTADLLAWLAENARDAGPGVKKEKVLIDFCLPSGRYYMRYELYGVQVVSCGLDYSDDPGDVTETLEFIYDHIRILKRPILASGEVDIAGEDAAEYEVLPAEGPL